ncbi:hypothetical protein [Corallincola spongiicola]|uniref:Uncharacterized protein n=1 Tax=Corallincola spongiicola TaxID=2520508 RepID=A0ABY1WUE5_9GAMM|nr:hypothetical protein [Corallincola spongiicola]TAA48355.1 hypothetical protein EXY25_03750 [Corallincola spongiicola]
MENLFLHTKDKKWIKRREAFWNKHLEYDFKMEGVTKAQTQAYKNYYLTGDIALLLKKVSRKKLPVSMFEVVRYGPFGSQAEFNFVVHYYCENYLADKVSCSDINVDVTKEEIQSYLIDLVNKLDDEFIGDFAYGMVKILHGETISEKPVEYPTEFSVIGKLSLSFNPNKIIQRLLSKFRDYLFNKQRHKTHYKYKELTGYLLSVLPIIDTLPFSTKLIEKKYYGDEYDYDPYLNQGSIRLFFSNLYGYMHDLNEKKYFGFFDPEYQSFLKDKVEELELGEEFNAMIDMVHRHEGKIIYISE